MTVDNSRARDFLAELVRKLDTAKEHERPIPVATAPLPHRRLCVAMSVYDDFDGAYFTVQALRLYHPEVADQLSVLIIDNHPEGIQSQALSEFASHIDNVRYLPFTGYRSTAVRDLLFREADADIVCCVDSHVLLAPGSMAALLGWFDEHPDSRDLVQGPLLVDDFSYAVGTHFEPVWGAGMWGQWATDSQVEHPDGEAFDIPMQGLGVFACRKDAWPGINSRFRGFGGEEGYLHEKFRQAGGRTLCLPGLRWAHRFARPSGVPYQLVLEDRVRNYRIGWGEVGLDQASMEAHFREEYASLPHIEQILEQTKRQVDNPFGYFDAIFSLNLDTEVDRWQQARHRYDFLDIGWRVERVSAVATPHNHHEGCALSWRAMVQSAQRRGYRHFLGLEDDAVFHLDTLQVLSAATAELDDMEWDLCYLGAVEHGDGAPLPGSQVLRAAGQPTCTHAVAIHQHAFERILADVPAEPGPALNAWMREEAAIDQYFARLCHSGELRGVVLSPHVASQPALLGYADADLAIAEHFQI